MNEPKKRGRGRPEKVDPLDAKAIIAKIKDEEQRFSAKCADNMQKLFNNIFNLAMDDKAPIKDHISATRYCIEFADNFLNSSSGKQPSKGKEDTPPVTQKPVGSLISLKAVDK